MSRHSTFSAGLVLLPLILGGCTASQEAAPAADPAATSATVVDGGLRYTGVVRVHGDSLRDLWAEVRVSNPGPTPVDLRYGGCPLRVVLRTEGDEGRTMWDSSRWTSSCPAILADMAVAPGEEISPPRFQLRFPLERVVADTVPAGSYAVDVDVELLHRRGSSTRPDTVRLTVGTLALHP